MKRCFVCHLGVMMALLLLPACNSIKYATLEKFGIHKRDVLVDSVADAKKAQGSARDAFADALEQFSSVVRYEGGDLETKYNKLNKAFKQSEHQAREVNERVDAIESVAKALFKEWRAELKQYSSNELRRQSKQQYDLTLAKYKKLMKSMRRAAATMDPVLDALRDQVLFLKHNLNARAIAGIEGETSKVEAQVATLIRQMEDSIAEADAFIAQMGAP